MTVRTEVITLSEYGELEIDDDIAQLVDQSFWLALGITVSRRLGESSWVAKASSLSGIARTISRELDLTVQIQPKLAGADVVFLAEHAYGQRVNALRRPEGGRVGVDSAHSDPIATLLIWYVEAVGEFATRWLRRSYRRRNVTLDGQVRGRVRVGAYVARSLTTGRANEIPCVITERTIDTANNQVLKAGLRRVAKLATALPVPAARDAVRRAVAGVLPRFSEVTDAEAGIALWRGTTTRGPERHYTSILDTTRDLLEGRFLGQSLGTAHVASFLWSMPDLFQEAVRGLLNEAPALSLDTARKPSALYLDSAGARLRSSGLDPDFVLREGARYVLLDAKYKNALGIAGDDTDLVMSARGPKLRVGRSDLYQLAAYRQNDRWRGSPVALIYPVVVGSEETVPEPYVVNGIGAPIWLVFVDVGRNARRNAAVFIETVRALHERPQVVEALK